MPRDYCFQHCHLRTAFDLNYSCHLLSASSAVAMIADEAPLADDVAVADDDIAVAEIAAVSVAVVAHNRTSLFVVVAATSVVAMIGDKATAADDAADDIAVADDMAVVVAVTEIVAVVVVVVADMRTLLFVDVAAVRKILA